jgi:PTS system nitrogen regulatory IIA component
LSLQNWAFRQRQQDSSKARERTHDLASLIAAEDVILNLDAQDGDVLFDAVGEHWSKRFGLRVDVVSNALRSRESRGSTALGKGVAIPHARLPFVHRPLVALVRTRAGVSFDSPDEEPVFLFLVLIVPSECAQEQIQLLSDAARIFSRATQRRRLGSCGSSDEVLVILKESEATPV